MLPDVPAVQADRDAVSAALEDAPFGFVVSGLDGRWRAVNRTLCRFLDRSADDLVGRHPDELTHGGDVAATAAAIAGLAAGDQELLRLDKRYLRPDGTVVHARLTARLVRDEGGLPHHWVTQVEDRTEQIQAEQELQQQRWLGQALLDATDALVFVKDTDFVYQQVNAAFAAMSGRTAQECVGSTDYELFPRPVADVYRANDEEILAGGARQWREVEVPDARLGSRRYRAAKFPLVDVDGAVWGIGAIGHDVTAEVAARVALEEATAALISEQQKFRAAFIDGATPIALLDLDGVVREGNPALRRLLGCPSSRLVGHPLSAYVAAEDVERWTEALTGPGTRASPIEVRVRTLDGRSLWCEVSTTRVAETDGVGVLVQVLDVDARKTHELRLEDAVRQDQLTGLGNRHVLRSRLDELLRPGGPGAVLLLVDLDGFKAVNDVHGHEAGDAVLVEVAARLRAGVRPDDVVVRLGGDEFVVVARAPVPRADRVARRLETRLSAPLTHSGTVLPVGASIGTASAVAGSDPAQALAAADRAMYARKRRRAVARRASTASTASATGATVSGALVSAPLPRQAPDRVARTG